MKPTYLLTAALLVMMVSSCCKGNKQKTRDSAIVEEPAMNTLSVEEESEGWQLLFNGKTTEGWRDFNEKEISGWEVSEGCLVGMGLGGDIGGDIVSVNEYENFILKWEWKLGPNGNSGVLYHVAEGEKYKAPYETGPEYQLIEDDDFRNADGSKYELEEWQKTAADYAMYIPNDEKEVNTRDWNSSKIVFREYKVEY